MSLLFDIDEIMQFLSWTGSTSNIKDYYCNLEILKGCLTNYSNNLEMQQKTKYIIVVYKLQKKNSFNPYTSTLLSHNITHSYAEKSFVCQNQNPFFSDSLKK